MKNCLAGLLAITALPVLASTATAEEYGDAAARLAHWSGFYVGVHGGSARDNTNWDVGPSSASIQLDPDGTVWGGLIGYNFQIDNYVLGVEADFTRGDLSDGPKNVGIGGLQSAEVDESASLRARFGYDLGSFMPFVTGGYGTADLHLHDTFGGGPVEDTKRLHGYVAGGGVDIDLGAVFGGTSGSLIARVEYLHGQYRPVNFQIGATPEPADLESNVIRAALIWKLGGGM